MFAACRAYSWPAAAVLILILFFSFLLDADPSLGELEFLLFCGTTILARELATRPIAIPLVYVSLSCTGLFLAWWDSSYVANVKPNVFRISGALSPAIYRMTVFAFDRAFHIGGGAPLWADAVMAIFPVLLPVVIAFTCTMIALHRSPSVDRTREQFH